MDRRIVPLSDAAFRLFVVANAWSVSNRTDGVVYDSDLRLIPGVDPGAVSEVQKAGLWHRVRDHWVIADFDAVQSSSHELTVLDNARRRQREKKARQRARKAAEAAGDGDDDPEGAGQDAYPGNTYPGMYPGTAQARRGEARQGLQGFTSSGVENLSTRDLNRGRDEDEAESQNQHQGDDSRAACWICAAWLGFRFSIITGPDDNDAVTWMVRTFRADRDGVARDPAEFTRYLARCLLAERAAIGELADMVTDGNLAGAKDEAGELLTRIRQAVKEPLSSSNMANCGRLAAQAVEAATPDMTARQAIEVAATLQITPETGDTP